MEDFVGEGMPGSEEVSTFGAIVIYITTFQKAGKKNCLHFFIVTRAYGRIS